MTAPVAASIDAAFNTAFAGTRRESDWSDSMRRDPGQLVQLWQQWVEQEIGGPPDRVAAATRAAIGAIAAGNTDREAIRACARQAASLWDRSQTAQQSQRQQPVSAQVRPRITDRGGRPIGRGGALVRLPFFALPATAVVVFLLPAIPQFEAASSDPRLPLLAAYAMATLPVAVAIIMTLVSVIGMTQLVATIVSPTVRAKAEPGGSRRSGARGLGLWLLPLAIGAAAVYVVAVARPAHVSRPQPPVSVQPVTPLHLPPHLLEDL